MISNFVAALLPAGMGLGIALMGGRQLPPFAITGWRVLLLAWLVAAVSAEIAMQLLTAEGAESHVIAGLGGLALPTAVAWAYARSALPMR